ncbi:hypothetical protein HETIRDRAFT_417056 [Heterobasidion irregulare TC 32-1]|uniref:Uncharacterized protein n=1 Tax=Heterobasidion irregulare (strain TC 32-1) TaxID=747525 RepID=W4KB37_HETIT|nr:uncharacterized protein HETIRDRAFT_417056 [Heterobasidion irregulare TC 32-1]ETW83052.1 hypothetical protein HETIRDRAFT_417056 [Heterobasidion irregulare TC 32-1]
MASHRVLLVLTLWNFILLGACHPIQLDVKYRIAQYREVKLIGVLSYLLLVLGAFSVELSHADTFSGPPGLYVQPLVTHPWKTPW